jgi:Ferritin-like
VIAHVATEEMFHLALVQNLLSAIGAAPHLARPNLPAPARHYPAGVNLTLAHSRCDRRRWQASERRSPSIAGYRRFGGKAADKWASWGEHRRKNRAAASRDNVASRDDARGNAPINAEGRDFSQPSSFVRKSLSFPLFPTRRKSSLHPPSGRAHHPFGGLIRRVPPEKIGPVVE